jgi:hypothetical protein
MENIWKFVNNRKIILLLNILVIAFIFFLPYYIFEGKLYLGGDDSKLMYSYPFEFLKNLSFFSWAKFSSISGNEFPQFRIPFLLAESLLMAIVGNRLFLNYFIFSLPLVVGFISFQYLVNCFFKNSLRPEIFVGGLLYVFSPIVVVNQLANFYSSVWLIAIVPIISYCLIKYIRTSDVYYILLNIIMCTLFSFGLASIPWVFAVLFPIILSLIFLPFFFKNTQAYLKKIIIYFGLLLLSQSYWILPFISASFNMQKNNLGEKILSGYNGFSQTVLSTATGSIINPLLNLFHRQIAFDFRWLLSDIFTNYYDKTLIFNMGFIVILFLGILSFKAYLSFREKRYYLIFLIIFAISLFLFTVNIGPFKNLFLFLGNVPGFIMFRNFYDKFAFVFSVFYSILLTFSLVIIGRKFPKFRIAFLFIVFILVAINVVPIKNIVNHPLWTTKKIYTNINFPKEYIDFISAVEKNVQPTSNVLSLPFNYASYAFIKEENSNNTYVGNSPLLIFTGINDFSGDLSFRSQDSNRFNNYLNEGKVKSLSDFFKEFNINFVIRIKNVPAEIKYSYLLESKDLRKQDQKFINSIVGQEIVESEKGNYVLYSTKNQYPIFSQNNIIYQRINSVTYKIYVSAFSGKNNFIFKDSYNAGWKLYLDNRSIPCKSLKIYVGNIGECVSKNVFIQGNEWKYLTEKAIFEKSHKEFGANGNKWTLDADFLKTGFDDKRYSVNKDGSINFTLTLFFFPQLYFYLGAILSFLTFLVLVIYYILFPKFYDKVY